ncbi:precorrin-6Y C5,15-methyltransferase (decarboxylating) subunit CbiT [Brassicibacter mesophilus]|uniref:precorrin-6Y C5,15-methyltransferase (decarboxylating) subunit CbiT n=1 Tax=Brassicibacter mesophilus TaxID=745119 RepID=UPI003D243DD5
MENKWRHKTPGIPDEMFIRGMVPMTKEEVRSITIGKLRINNNDIIVDIGAGTGSISIEAALQAFNGKIYAVERNEEAVQLIIKNKAKFEVKNIQIIEGVAPSALEVVPTVDKAIIGGSGGNLNGIFDWLDMNLKQNGRAIINAITIETVYKSLDNLKSRNYDDIEVVHVAISKSRSIANLTMMEAQNPIYIISATKR